MASSRFPGKPLHPLNSVPMIGHCYHRTRLALGAANTYVATCDEEIERYITSIGGKVVMTSASHSRASERAAEALLKIEKSLQRIIDVVVMVQGDEPLVHPKSIQSLTTYFSDPTVEIVNLMSPIKKRADFRDSNNVKVVFDRDSNALYFSREGIPSGWKNNNKDKRFMQTGIIAFTKPALLKFNCTNETPLEIIESVDMNRVLENGGSIKMVAGSIPTLGVDTEREAKRAAELLLKPQYQVCYDE